MIYTTRSNHDKLHDKLKNEKDILKYYNCITEENRVFTQEKGERYEKELIQILKQKENVNTLHEFIQKLEHTNPFENGYVPRKEYSEKINDRLSLIKQDKVKNPFNYIVNGKKGSSLEPMIQRHIMLSNKYDSVLGKPLFYEFPCNTYNKDTPKNKKGKVPIDLITYDEENKILYLVELKKCSACSTCKKGNFSESKELFLRALLEVTTYYTFFIHLIALEKEKVENALSKVGGINFSFDKVKEIRKAILAPKIIFDSVYTEELKGELDKVDCFTISTIKDDISDISINTNDKVFEIEKI